MSHSVDVTASRRLFLKFLAGSPLFASLGLSVAATRDLLALPGAAAAGLQGSAARPQGNDLIASAKDAIDLFDFEAVARKKLRPAHWGYLATGVDDDATIAANREGFTRFQLRVRRLIDVHAIDTSVTILGATWPTPIMLAPVGSLRTFHPDGELAVARAARANGGLFILSTVATASVEDVTAARGGPVWFQLYPTTDWDVTTALVKRAEAAGCPVLVLTVDMQGGSNRETIKRFTKKDDRTCSVCHEAGGGFARSNRHRPMFDGLDLSRVKGTTPLDMTWDYVRRLKDTTKMKVFLKGIVTREDAELSVKNGIDGVIVSNHGGRAEESLRSTIESLPEVVEVISGRIPVLIDGGFRRGTDIFKALALGANAICIGRPYLWGLAAFGQPGVEAVVEILRQELQLVMRQAGTTSIGMITRAYVADRSR
jgi:isopentenyl diphosphate isomerase/L-lactate dehydrogenase-like FMN-dependent dehydrogenase